VLLVVQEEITEPSQHATNQDQDQTARMPGIILAAAPLHNMAGAWHAWQVLVVMCCGAVTCVPAGWILVLHSCMTHVQIQRVQLSMGMPHMHAHWGEGRHGGGCCSSRGCKLGGCCRHWDVGQVGSSEEGASGAVGNVC
jgi:hypothetical protein